MIHLISGPDDGPRNNTPNPLILAPMAGVAVAMVLVRHVDRPGCAGMCSVAEAVALLPEELVDFARTLNAREDEETEEVQP